MLFPAFPRLRDPSYLGMTGRKSIIYSTYSWEVLLAANPVAAVVQMLGGQVVNTTRTDRETTQRNHQARLGIDYQLSKKTMVTGLVSLYDDKWSMDAVNKNTIFFNSIPNSTSHFIHRTSYHSWKVCC
jgi:hypothetical protein